jgi:hypothetical protein
MLDWISVLHWLAIGTYFCVAARRLYEESAARTGIKSVLFVIGAQLTIVMIQGIMIFSVGVRATIQALDAAHG